MSDEMVPGKAEARVIVANIFYGEAEHIKRFLASAGIDCRIHGSRTWGVEVASEDGERAIQLLHEYARRRPYWITVYKV